MPHPLDHPIWTALTTRHQTLAEGGDHARRYPTAITPFADMAEISPRGFAALGAMMLGSEIAVLFTPDAVTAPVEFKVLLAETGEQMTGTPADVPAGDVDILTLGANDVPDMMALTALTKPGPFSLRTHELGTFLGIRIDGQLVAMAGERMKPADYTEMTAVCVHPSHRGHGYGKILLSAISRQIVARGEIPFLHVFTSNASAIALYRRQRMEIRRRLHVTVRSRCDRTALPQRNPQPVPAVDLCSCYVPSMMDAYVSSDDARLFLAAIPDPGTATRIHKLSGVLKRAHQFSGKLIEPECLHVSLFFLGGLPEQDVRAACAAAADVRMEPFEVLFDRTASFRGKRDSRPFVLVGDKGLQLLTSFRRMLGSAMMRRGLRRAWRRRVSHRADLLGGERVRAHSKPERP